MQQMPRIAMLVVAVAVTAGATVMTEVQPRATLFAKRTAARLSQPTALMRAAVDMPVESYGRVEVWQNERQLAADAAAAAKARGARPAGPAPTIPSYPPGTVQDIITKVFTPLGATAVAWGLRVARCESGYNARSYNPAGPYYGLFQFLMSTFKATPYGGQDIYDPTANASAAAWKYSRGGAGAWGCK